MDHRRTEQVDDHADRRAVDDRYRLLAETTRDLVEEYDRSWRLVWASPSVQGLLGWTSQEMVGRFAPDLLHPDDDWSSDRGAVDAGLVGGMPEHRRRVRRLRADGTYLWVDSSLSFRHDPSGAVQAAYVISRDISDQVATEEELRQAHERLELVLASSRLGLWDWDMRTGETVFDERWAQIVGYRLADLGPTTIDTWALLAHPDDMGTIDRLITAHADGRTDSYDLDARMRHRDGHWVWVRDRGRIVARDPDGRPLRMTGTREDITAFKQAVDDLAASEERLRVAMASAPVGMAVLDADRRVTQANPALCALLDRSEEWLLERCISDVLDRHGDLLDRRIRATLAQAPRAPVTFEHRLGRADGSWVWVQQAIRALHDADHAVTGYVSQFTDVTDAREARRRLRDLASRDPLTGLLNRRELDARLEVLLGQRERAGSVVAVLFVDLDGLKQVNDTHGHLVGDRVIAGVAERIRTAVRSDDVVARYGGDEFVVLLQVRRLRDAERIAEQVQATAREPVTVDGVAIPVTYSIGIATTDAATDPDAVLARADAAAYRAKRDGRNRTAVFDPGLDTPDTPAAGLAGPPE